MPTFAGAERYYRCIVYHRFIPSDQFRPLMSYPTLADAVVYVDLCRKHGNEREMKIIDLEHIDMGDMLVHPDCADMIARIRAERG